MKTNPYKIYPQYIPLASMILRMMIDDGYISSTNSKQLKESNQC
jgi:hypothetical protein